MATGEIGDEASSYADLAKDVEDRAERIDRHAAWARRQAVHDAEARNDELLRLHVEEAEIHERCAVLMRRTAALYRARAEALAARKARGGPRTAKQVAKARAELTATLLHSADVLEQSAGLAAAAADRLDRYGRDDAAAVERAAAEHAREAAARAISQARSYSVGD